MTMSMKHDIPITGELDSEVFESISHYLNLHKEELSEVFRAGALHWLTNKPDDPGTAAQLASIAYAFLLESD